VMRLAIFIGVEEKPVWADAKDGGHSAVKYG